MNGIQFYLLIGGLNCNNPTFHNTPVKFNYKTEIAVTGRILPQVLPLFYPIDDKEGLEISVTNQSIASINECAVADFPVKLFIHFNFNYINTVKRSAFVNLPKLLHVYLHSNRIYTIESGAFSNLPFLKYVRLSNNDIESLEVATFQDLPELINVDLEHNQIGVFNKDWFKNTPKVSSLTLANNLIRTIPNRAFINLPRIWNLDFTSNRIEIIEKDAFYGLGGLRALFLGNNRIRTLHVDFGSLLVETLAIQMNNLTSIPEAVLRDVEKSVKTLSAYGNPLQCACYDKIIRWSDEHNLDDPFKDDSNSEANPVCVFLSNQTKCIEQLDQAATWELNRIFHENYSVP